MSDLDEDRVMWSVIFQAATAITEKEETTGKVVSPKECKAIVDGLCAAREISFSDQRTKATHMTVQSIRGSAVVKELTARWRKEGQLSFTNDDINRASENLQSMVSDFLGQRQ